MGNLQCKWVRDRLPLLAGDELRGMDLRRVERHPHRLPEMPAASDVARPKPSWILHTGGRPAPGAGRWRRPSGPSWPGKIRHFATTCPAPVFLPGLVGFGLWPAFGLGLGLVAASDRLRGPEPGGRRTVQHGQQQPRPIAPGGLEARERPPPAEAPASTDSPHQASRGK